MNRTHPHPCRKEGEGKIFFLLFPVGEKLIFFDIRCFEKVGSFKTKNGIICDIVRRAQSEKP